MGGRKTLGGTGGVGNPMRGVHGLGLVKKKGMGLQGLRVGLSSQGKKKSEPEREKRHCFHHETKTR